MDDALDAGAAGGVEEGLGVGDGGVEVEEAVVVADPVGVVEDGRAVEGAGEGVGIVEGEGVDVEAVAEGVWAVGGVGEGADARAACEEAFCDGAAGVAERAGDDVEGGGGHGGSVEAMPKPMIPHRGTGGTERDRLFSRSRDRRAFVIKLNLGEIEHDQIKGKRERGAFTSERHRRDACATGVGVAAAWVSCACGGAGRGLRREGRSGYDVGTCRWARDGASAVSVLFDTVAMADPTPYFRNRYYFRLNLRRHEHLSALGLPLHGRRVLEVGAGIGDHTEYFLDRGCRVTATEGREDNVAFLAARYRDDERVDVRRLDLDDPVEGWARPAERWEVCYCYGVLYHLCRPAEALGLLAPRTSSMLLLETVCAYGDDESVNLWEESEARCSQSLRGTGCRPTRRWVWNRLGELFEHVYVPLTQPWHDEFQIDWTPRPGNQRLLGRGVFVATREPLQHPLLSSELVVSQRRG